MGKCCALQSDAKPENVKLECPVCGEKCLYVPTKTVKQHIKQPWDYSFVDAQYYYCRNFHCDTVYFSTENELIRKPEIRTHIGIKNSSDEALICFCFGVNKLQAATNKHAKEFVIKQTKKSMCSCETANPSGQCCLKDFPKTYD